MSKHKRQKAKGKIPPPLPTLKPTRLRAQYPVLAWLLAIATLLGGLAAVLTFLPRVVVSPPTSPIDPRNAMSVSFDVINTGFIPLWDVSASLGLGEITNSGGLVETAVPTFKSRIIFPGWEHHRLGMDDRFTVDLSEWMGLWVTAADIAIVVSYRPGGLPITKERVFRFVATRGSDGKPRWKSWPVGEKMPRA
jgi:hypothetical protein